MSTRASRARAVIATGRRPSVVARVAGVSRQALSRRISRRPTSARPGHGRPGDDAIVEVARANAVDGTRMVAALASRQLGEPVNRKRVTAGDFRKHLSARGISHRRGGYRDPESQALIESWFGQFKMRCAWRTAWEIVEQARTEIAAHIETYHHRHHSGIGYRTPTEVALTWAQPRIQTTAT